MIEQVKKNSIKNLEADYNKLRVDDIKSELKKRGISFSKYAVKSELTELLAKHEKSGENK